MWGCGEAASPTAPTLGSLLLSASARLTRLDEGQGWLAPTRVAVAPKPAQNSSLEAASPEFPVEANARREYHRDYSRSPRRLMRRPVYPHPPSSESCREILGGCRLLRAFPELISAQEAGDVLPQAAERWSYQAERSSVQGVLSSPCAAALSAERCHLNNLPTNAAAHTSCGVVTPDDWCAKSYSPSTLQCIAQRVC
jgi:hypothetical protein